MGHLLRSCRPACDWGREKHVGRSCQPRGNGRCPSRRENGPRPFGNFGGSRQLSYDQAAEGVDGNVAALFSRPGRAEGQGEEPRSFDACGRRRAGFPRWDRHGAQPGAARHRAGEVRGAGRRGRQARVPKDESFLVGREERSDERHGRRRPRRDNRRPGRRDVLRHERPARLHATDGRWIRSGETTCRQRGDGQPAQGRRQREEGAVSCQSCAGDVRGEEHQGRSDGSGVALEARVGIQKRGKSVWSGGCRPGVRRGRAAETAGGRRVPRARRNRGRDSRQRREPFRNGARPCPRGYRPRGRGEQYGARQEYRRIHPQCQGGGIRALQGRGTGTVCVGARKKRHGRGGCERRRGRGHVNGLLP